MDPNNGVGRIAMKVVSYKITKSRVADVQTQGDLQINRTEEMPEMRSSSCSAAKKEGDSLRRKNQIGDSGPFFT